MQRECTTGILFMRMFLLYPTLHDQVKYANTCVSIERGHREARKSQLPSQESKMNTKWTTAVIKASSGKQRASQTCKSGGH